MSNIDERVGNESESPSSSNAAVGDGQHDVHVANQECPPHVSSRSHARVPVCHVRRHDIPRDLGSPAANMPHAKRCKEVERLNKLVFATHAAIDATVQMKQRTRSQKGKASNIDLINKIMKVAIMFKKKLLSMRV